MRRKGIITFDDLSNEGMICEDGISIDYFVQRDVLNHRFEILPGIVREGDMNKLSRNTKEIIALYLEGRLKTTGKFENRRKFSQTSFEDDILRRFRELVPEDKKGTKNSRKTAIGKIQREYEAIGDQISYRNIEEYIAKAEIREQEEALLEKQIAHESD